MKRSLLLLVSVALVVFAAAADRAQTADTPKPDPRLNARVTIAAKAQPIGDFLKDLSEQVGVRLSAHLNVKDQRVTVLVREQPLDTLMEHLTQVLDARWYVKDVRDTVRYYIKQKPGWRESVRQRQVRARQELRDAVDGMRAAAGLSAGELRALASTDPVAAIQMAWLPDPGGPPGLALLAALSDDKLDALFARDAANARRKSIRLRYSDLSPAAQAQMDETGAFVAGAFHSRIPRLDPRDYEVSLSIARSRDEMPTNFGLSIGTGRVGMHLLDIERRPELHTWKGIYGVPETAQQLDMAEGQLLDALERTQAGRDMVAAMKAEKERGARQLQLSRGVDSVKLELWRDDHKRLADVLAVLHEAFPVDFVADAYLAKPGRLSGVERPPGKAPVYGPDGRERNVATVPKDPDKMLDHIAACFDREWTRERGIVRLQSRHWREDLLLDPPGWVIDHLLNRRKKNGRLLFDDLVLAAQNLADTQLWRLRLINRLPLRSDPATKIRRHADLLRLYGSLNPGQQWAVFHGGLPSRAMTEWQARLFAACLRSHFVRDLIIEDAGNSLLSLAHHTESPKDSTAARAPAEYMVFTLGLPSGDSREVRMPLPRPRKPRKTPSSAASESNPSQP